MSRTDSTAPPEANPDVRRPDRRSGPRGPLGFVWESTVMGWRWLVRMRTALYLLGLLALWTLVATIVPQEPNVAQTAAAWREGTAGPGRTISAVLDLFGAFDAYGSATFLAILLLLFLSLTACLIPRIRAWVRLVRTSRPPLTRAAGRQQLVATLETDRSVAEVHAAAADRLRRSRWRVRTTDEEPPDEGVVAAPPPAQVAAEKGLWSREGGSLLFHVSFYVLLIAVVYGQLASFEGQRAVVEGQAFTDTRVSYWTYGGGRWWGEDAHRGWQLQLDEFHVDWVRDPQAPGAGQPTLFRSDVTVTRADGTVVTTDVEGNEPLVVDGMKIHQLDWGYAPRVQVEVDGEVLFDDHLIAVATDGGAFRGAVKVPQAEPDVGLDVFLVPYARATERGPEIMPVPWADQPLLIYQQYRGDLQLGVTQQSINELDTSLLESAGGGMLRPGGEVRLADGVVVRFPELRRWVGFQVSARPQVPLLLLASGLLLAGLVPALYAYRRRLWVVAVRDEVRGRTLVTVAGRAFQRPEAFEDEHADVVRRLARAIDADAPSAAATRPEDDPTPTGAAT